MKNREECERPRNVAQLDSICRLAPKHDGNHCYRYDSHPKVIQTGDI